MRVVLILFITLLSLPLHSQVQKFTLDNGLKIVVKEDHRAPIAVSMVWYDVGSADEKGGTTGVSHALEHLMFKGTPTYPAGVFSQTIASLGGQENAFTNNDYTAYYEKIAVQNLETALAMEADRMQHLIFEKNEFAHELKVIQEERRMRTDDSPPALTFERFLATAHLSSPYHHPVIGWMSDLEEMTLHDAEQWYKRYYTPNNATLVVVGDVNPEQVHQLAIKHFGPLEKRPLPERKEQKEPPVLGQKNVEVHLQSQVPLLMLGYVAPSVKTVSSANTKEPYVLEVIASILDGGDSGRVNDKLVRGKNIASSVEIYYNLYARFQTQFIIYGTPSSHSDLTALKNGIIEELNRLKTTTISEQELNRAKAQIAAEKTFEKDSIFGQAMELGLLETIGLGWQEADEYLDKINSVTPTQIQQVANHFFNEEALTEARLIPKERNKDIDDANAEASNKINNDANKSY